MNDNDVGYPGIAGREIAEERRDGDVCDSACYYVFHHAGTLDPQAFIFVIMLRMPLIPWSASQMRTCKLGF